MGGWAVLFFRPSPRTFRVAEATAFFAASMGLAALEHGLYGPTPIFLSCTLLAQGIAVPRPWRQGIVSLGVTWLGFVIGLAATFLLTHRSEAQWHDPHAVLAQARNVFFALGTAAFAVISGDASFSLRRQAREAQRVGTYRLRAKLGGGAMGEVWKAHHPGLGQDVAVKLAKSERAAARLGLESDLLGAIAHPNVVRLLDRGRTDGGLPFYAMELAIGETLEARVSRDGPLSPAGAIAVARDLCRALSAVHAAGIVHRDVKPANVVIAAHGAELRATLVDFGVATRTGDRADVAIGSPRFMAPEQRAGAIDPRADVFACGAVLFYALAGRSPLDTGGEPSTDAIAPALASLDAPEALRMLLGRALAIDPAERLPTAAALRDALIALA
jgi:serine/threonine-protein kinase